MRRQLGQLSLADGLVTDAGGPSSLDRVFGLVDWAAFDELLVELHAARVGRPAHPPLLMFRCLLLQQWYRLSDPGLEEALADRLSFRRFAGLALGDPVPDHSALSRFRKQLTGLDLGEKLLAELNRQLDAKGLILRQGTLIDATLVAADARPPRPAREDRPARPGADPEAGWNAMPKLGRPLYGYKAHVGADQGSGLVRDAVLTPAHVSDRDPAPELIQGDEKAVYGDKGYDGWELRDRLAAQGIEDAIMRPDYHKRRLDDAGRARNRAIARVRSAVERVFAHLKCGFGWRRVRYRGLARNALHLQILCVALNLRRAATLLG